jgi:hypothetical protein
MLPIQGNPFYPILAQPPRSVGERPGVAHMRSCALRSLRLFELGAHGVAARHTATLGRSSRRVGCQLDGSGRAAAPIGWIHRSTEASYLRRSSAAR